ncbi:histidinol-phosphatase HisJ family protein [Arenicella sp.]|nr:histidinol-phosphatase HisJ family protein [Arenicella sp.]
MRGLTDYHTHNALCRHAEGRPVDYARQAEKIGLAEFGCSDHSPMEDDDFDDWRMKWSEFPQYVAEVEEARSGVEIPVRLGLEVDYLEGGEGWIERLSKAADFDYLIGAVHYIAPEWAVDDPQWIGKFRDEASVEEIWGTYWRIYTKCVASGLFDILAHPDLPKKFGHTPGGDLKRFYAPAIEAAVAADVVFEVNTAGYRKDCSEQYPSGEFLDLMREANLPVVINSDAHAPEEVGAGFCDALQLVRAAGFTETVRFEKRGRKVVPLPEA